MYTYVAWRSASQSTIPGDTTQAHDTQGRRLPYNLWNVEHGTLAVVSWSTQGAARGGEGRGGHEVCYQQARAKWNRLSQAMSTSPFTHVKHAAARTGPAMPATLP